MVCALLALASGACKKEEEQAATPAAAQQDSAAAPAATDTVVPRAPAPPASLPDAAPPQGRSPAATASPVAVRDVPYASDDTGTVAPGMSEADVVAMWGRPVARSATGAMTYLYFPNGCELSCGTMDVVMLENDRVVDAVLRWPGHGYSGQSSSPPGRTPAATPPVQPNP
jgi:hypothetical protein